MVRQPEPTLPSRSAALRRRLVAASPWLVVAGMVLVLALVGLFAAAAQRMRARPAWWQTVQAADPTVVHNATELENAVLSTLSERRELLDAPDGSRASADWWVAVPAEDANAWLSARLPRWVAAQSDISRWPDELAEVRVSFEAPFVRVGARVDRGGQSRYLAATFIPQLRSDGSLWLVAERVSIGTLNLPAGWVLDGAEARADDLVPEAFRGLPQSRDFFRMFAGEIPATPTPEIDLQDGRRVRLLALRAGQGRLELKCRTEHRGTQQASGG
jgi:hypothetical protein